MGIRRTLEAGQVSNIHKSVGADYKSKLIDPAIQEAFKASVAKYDVTQLITDRPAAKADALKLLQQRLEPHGIYMQDLSIVDFKFSEEFTKAIEAKQVAAQEAERAQYNLDRAKLDAQAQEAQKESLSPLLLQKQAIEKWDGKLPNYLGSGTVFNIPLQ
jgi:regulator of protease activity HflC (stomatin/prohibitin superfamily)